MQSKIYTFWVYGYKAKSHNICMKRNHVPIYFMYKSRAIKVEPMNNFWKAMNKNNKWQVRNKVSMKNILSIEFQWWQLYSLNRWRRLIPAQCFIFVYLSTCSSIGCSVELWDVGYGFLQWSHFSHKKQIYFSLPQIEYLLGDSSKHCSHVYFLLLVFWVVLLFC